MMTFFLQKLFLVFLIANLTLNLISCHTLLGTKKIKKLMKTILYTYLKKIKLA